MKRLKLTLLGVVGLIAMAGHSQARLGWTLAECEAYYGEGRVVDPNIYSFSFKSKSSSEVQYLIIASFGSGVVSRIWYTTLEPMAEIYMSDAEYLLKAEAPEALWSGPIKNATDVYWSGTASGQVFYSAHLTGTQSFELWSGVGDVEGATGVVVGDDGVTHTVLPPQVQN